MISLHLASFYGSLATLPAPAFLPKNHILFDTRFADDATDDVLAFSLDLVRVSARVFHGLKGGFASRSCSGPLTCPGDHGPGPAS